MPRTPNELLSPADQERRRSLRTMKGIALGALIGMAVLFAVAFVLQQDMPGWGYVRAAAEGGMVGALADWFAVTALFRHPLGIPIPHTAIIPSRKDEIGRTLGEFVETNFLSAEVVRGKLESTNIAGRLGDWLRDPEHAARVGAEASSAGVGILTALSDDDVQDLIASIAREHLIDPDWGTPAGAALQRIVVADAQRPAIDLAVDSLGTWLSANQQSFEGFFSRRLPAWVPKIAHRLVDDTVYKEAVKFVDAMRGDPHHPARIAIDQYLAKLAFNLQFDDDTRSKLEGAKSAVFDSPKVRSLASDAWSTVKSGLIESLENPESSLRVRINAALADIGERLATEPALGNRVNTWITDAAAFVVDRYRHDIASIITDTIEKWDASETTEKIELMVGRDLQYIRLNGTIVGALAGVVIYTIAHALVGLF